MSAGDAEAAGTPPDVLRALFVAALKSWAVAEEKITRAVAAQYQVTPGSTPYRDPVTGSPLGTLQRTNPAPQWVVTDAAALRDHLMADAGNVETTEELDPPDPAELVALVRQHRPEWLRPITYLRDGVVGDALKRASATGEPEPGITLHRPEGVLRVEAAKGAREVFAQMIKAGRLNLDGTTPGVEPARRSAIETRLPELGTRVTARDRDRFDDAYDRGGGDWWQGPDPADDPFADIPLDPFAGITINTGDETR